MNNTEVVYAPSFELVVQIRDAKGNPTGKTKSITANNGNTIADFWQRNAAPKKKKKKKKNQNKELKIAEQKLKEILNKNDNSL